MLFSSCCLVVVRGEVGHGYIYLFFLSFISSLFYHCVLCQQSPTHYVCCCCSSFSSHSFQISLNAVLPTHSRSSSPPFPSNFWASALFANLSYPILFTCPAHFNLLLADFFLKLSFTPTLSVRPFFSFHSLHSRNYVVFVEMTLPL